MGLADVRLAGLALLEVLAHHGITKRGRQVVEKICLGKTNTQINALARAILA